MQMMADYAMKVLFCTFELQTLAPAPSDICRGGFALCVKETSG